ncbi:WavE lipopolysaccharide synthesis protein [Vibrio crassostreae]|uniref:WavE lipopolysaccharide synthesis family protein n=1 Tax=Vibrio crassostreae TaxID=246167 RepID=UPI001045A3BC|nr:WavE lipopolysaccharide synthesis family protein [Vibrio crassostreae]TCN84419.1 WavE lipopolysaccharide synthesis protein [Vibrio crassostreae]CAK2409480.1 WavE lipopolysaccharide synthesis protein [Vibrio crassostreae]CAK2414355.1 WavE lipopolysaccharide synthesis protein [Vibrio crassostreae]CAK3610174.1 WavE lipopolysaccharide synthesis protein [Vibrio crassostreae]CAK3796376.1 WavE lipopolysaccharide synthesis protein [Vibrio crassostreae]
MKNKVRLWIGLNFSYNMKNFILFIFNFFKNRNGYFTYHVRPVKSNDIIANPLSLQKSAAPRVGVIVQGPLSLKNNFTLETLKLYKELFPSAEIVLSTWLGQDAETIEAIRLLDVTVIESEYPPNIGHENINYQITTVKSGIKFLEGKVDFILKTRTDQRINGANPIDFLVSLLEKYPISNDGMCKMKKRIIGVNINTSRYKMYSVSDMFQFGCATDMQRMWDIELDYNTRFIPKNYYLGKSIQEVSDIMTAESFIIKSFLNINSISNENTLERYYDVLSNYFIIIDKEMIDLFWFKYSNLEYFFTYNYSKDRHRDKINFKDWFILYSNNGVFSNNRKDNAILNQRF